MSHGRLLALKVTNNGPGWPPDKNTRAIVGVHIGDRNRKGAQALWDSLPENYQKLAVSHTDYWEAYLKVFPEDRHMAVGKETGLTNHVERFNNTLRQRISRLVRKSLSFSKSLKIISVPFGILSTTIMRPDRFVSLSHHSVCRTT